MMKEINPAALELIDPSNQLLNSICEEVPADDVDSLFVQDVIDRMLELSAGKGHSKSDSRQMVGLAALQLGVAIRVITIDLTADGSNKKQDLQVFINPLITKKSEELVPGREGCWSCGNICGNVDRHKAVTIEALDRTGTKVTRDLIDFVARIAQHETDHLDGIRFPDRVPLNAPEKLHTVLPEEFPKYREEWANWKKLCSRQIWEDMKSGFKS